MKYTLVILLLSLSVASRAQSNLPLFLEGDWKVENKAIYEHWDPLNDHTLKGFSYKKQDREILVSEYLDITQTGDGIYYTASVLHQNQGKSISFRLTGTDSSFVFENAAHDFPKKIVYQKLSDTEVLVQVSDGQTKGFSYKMIRQHIPNAKDSTVSNPNFDPVLAEKLGGDDYGMKSYILVILKTGTNQTTDQDFIGNSFRGHMDNIHRLVTEGKLVVAGPLGKNERTYRGIFILQNIGSLEAARELLQTDPAISSGLLDVELYNWYGSAALPQYLDFSDKIWKVKP